MLQPGDPMCRELVADIETVVSSRYVEDPEPWWGRIAMKSDAPDSVEFRSLWFGDRLALLSQAPFWAYYEASGMTKEQMCIVLNNVVEGRIQELWLDDVFDLEAFRQGVRRPIHFMEIVGQRKNQGMESATITHRLPH